MHGKTAHDWRRGRSRGGRHHEVVVQNTQPDFRPDLTAHSGNRMFGEGLGQVLQRYRHTVLNSFM